MRGGVLSQLYLRQSAALPRCTSVYTRPRTALLETPGSTRVGATFARWAEPTTLASAGASESRKRPASGGENNWGLPGMMKIAKIAFVLFGLALPVSAYAESLGIE